MKLDANQLKYITSEEFKVLKAIEKGMRNHMLVPTPLVERIADLKYGGCKKLLKHLLKLKLVHHDAKRYDGYYLTYKGYDYLAMKNFVNRQQMAGIGRQIGIGKESDIFICIDNDNKEIVLKLQRLGRISFRQVRNKRDYGQKPGASWLYLSRLGALKEFAFMKALYAEGFPTPVPISWNRHCVLMSVVDGYPLSQIKTMGHPLKVLEVCLDLVVKLAEYGLIHGDFNEFNLMVNDKERVTMIDFPQMVSTSHKDAKEYFDRDVNCLHVFFRRRFNCTLDYWPELGDIMKKNNLDVQVSASGFTKKNQKEFDKLTVSQNGPEEILKEEESIKEEVVSKQKEKEEAVGKKIDEKTEEKTDKKILEEEKEPVVQLATKKDELKDFVKQKVKMKFNKKKSYSYYRKRAKKNAQKGKKKGSKFL